MRDHCTIPMQVCDCCGVLFALTPRRLKTGQRHCSRRCAVIARNIAGTHSRVVRVCIQCGAEMAIRPYDLERGRGRFCTRDCQMRYRTRPSAERVCDFCGAQFVVFAKGIRTGQRFCSRACQGRGKTPTRPASAVVQAERFWAKVQKTDGCWNWVGYRMKNGYGTLGSGNANYDQSKRLAHRVAYELTYGPIPAGKVIRHTCANPACCRPEHLLSGTQLENMGDCVEHGHSCAGERNAMAKLTDDTVRAIRADVARGITYAKLARVWHVQPGTIRSIATGRTWRHLL